MSMCNSSSQVYRHLSSQGIVKGSGPCQCLQLKEWTERSRRKAPVSGVEKELQKNFEVNRITHVHSAVRGSKNFLNRALCMYRTTVV